jgi:thioredoxin reductase
MYGFVSRDGIPPAEFRQIARAELSRYDNVRIRDVEVKAAKIRLDGRFDVQIGRAKVIARKLLLATGLRDTLPQVPGLLERFGTSVFQCPYCDGWESRGASIAVYGHGQRGFEMARALTAWTDDIALCTDGRSGLKAEHRQQLCRNGILLREEPIDHLEGPGGHLRQVVFSGGGTLLRKFLYFDMPSTPQSTLAETLACQFDRSGRVVCDRFEATTVPGVFAAGNIVRDVQLSIVAAAQGAKAAFGINRALTREDFDARHASRLRNAKSREPNS